MSTRPPPVVAVLLLVGGMLEEFVAARANRAVEGLAELLPNRVTVRRRDRDIIVRLEEVRVGDTLLVRSGERIAVDGKVLRGEASVTQAAVTMESMPVRSDRGRGLCQDPYRARDTDCQERGRRDDARAGPAHGRGAQERKAPVERILNTYAKFYTPAAPVLGGVLWLTTGYAP